MKIFGRPMTFVEECFQDSVTKKMVNVYKDNKGRYWLATSAWAWFRVRTYRL